MKILYALIDRIPKEDAALAEINTVIKIITKGQLYDAVDMEDVEEKSVQEVAEPLSAVTIVNKWYAQYKMKQTPQHNNKRNDEKKGETKVQRELKRRLSTKIVLGLLNVEPEALAELQKIDRIEFDIFKLRDKT